MSRTGKPRGMALSRDGLKLFVSDQSGHSLLVMTQTNKRVSDIPVGELPWGVVIRKEAEVTR